MYIHIGNNKSLPISSVIAVIRADDKHMKKNALFYYQSDNRNIIHVKPDEVEKTYIITDDTIYVSPVSIQTIKKRIHEFNSAMGLHSQG